MTKPKRLPDSPTLANPTACPRSAATPQLRPTVHASSLPFAPRDVCRQDEQSESPNPSVVCFGSPEIEVVNATERGFHRHSRHRYPHLRKKRTASVSAPLSASRSRDAEILVVSNIPTPCPSLLIGGTHPRGQLPTTLVTRTRTSHTLSPTTSTTADFVQPPPPFGCTSGIKRTELCKAPFSEF